MVQQYQVEQQVLRLIAPLDVDAVLDMYIQEGADGDPYWTRAWPSGIALAAQLLRTPQLVRGRRVCDLGCGLGVAGIAAALAGASEVVLLDREPLALQCALLSSLATGAAPLAAEAAAELPPKLVQLAQQLRHQQPQQQQQQQQQQQRQQHEEAGQHVPQIADCAAAGTPSASPSLPCTAAAAAGAEAGAAAAAAAVGGQQAAAADSQAAASPAAAAAAATTSLRTQQFDWSSGAPTPSGFDVVLACDVLYEGSFVDPIAKLVPRMLKPSSGLLLLADPPDRTAAHRERFLQLLASCRPTGFRVEQVSRVVASGVRMADNAPSSNPADSGVPIVFMALRRTASNDTVGVKLGAWADVQ